MLSLNVIRIIISETFSDDQKNFLKQFFNLRENDQFNIHRLLIDLSTSTRVKMNFTIKSRQMLIFYHSSIRLKPLKTDFIEIVNSIDDIDRFNTLLTDDNFQTIGDSEINKLKSFSIGKINNLIRKHFSPSIDQKNNIST